MSDFGQHRIIPSIYTSDGQSTIADSKNVYDYTKALELALKYEADGADELIFMDVTSIGERRRNLGRFLKDVSGKLKIPFVFGGGVHTTIDVEDLLRAGAKRIYVNSAAVRNPELINKISSVHGAKALLVAIDTRRTFGSWKVYLNGGKSRTEIDLINWVRMVELRGAGELLVSTITKGEQEPVTQVLNEITAMTHLPILASAGVQTNEDFYNLFTKTSIRGIVSANFFNKNGQSVKGVKDFLNEGFKKEAE